jgi:hypothetical protein
MGVHVRSAFHPLLGRVRIGASRVRPLFPKLHTLDCSSACPGSSTWVDKVPSRDTPSLNLAGCRGGVDPDNPQVARNQSKMVGCVTPALVRTVRRPGQPSVKAVTLVTSVRPMASRVRPDQRGDVGLGPGHGTENLAATVNRLDVADANLQVTFAVFAAADEG